MLRRRLLYVIPALAAVLVAIVLLGPGQMRSVHAARILTTGDSLRSMRVEVVEAYDHRFLNHEVPPFDRVVPTAENIAKDIWRRLEPRIDSNGRRLHSIRLYETPDLYVDYSGEGIEGDTHPAD